jgi:hypothetical protein
MQQNHSKVGAVVNVLFVCFGKAYFFFPEESMLKKAGEAQMSSGTSMSEWQKYEKIYWDKSEGGGIIIRKEGILPPYGDDPQDQNMIKRGFEYFLNRSSGNSKDNHKKTNTHKKHHSTNTGMMYRF